MYLALVNGLFLLRFGVGRRLDVNRMAYWFVLFGLFLFSAFRFRVGCDWIGYYENFTLGADLDYQSALALREPGWWLIQVALNRWELPYPIVNVVTSAIFFVGIHALARRQPDRLGFLVLLFPVLIVNMPMSGIRQAAAIGFLCLAFVAFIDKHPIRFAAWILIGSTFHSSALTFLLLAPLTTGRNSKRRALFAMVLAVPCAYLMGQSESARIALDRYVETGLDAYGSIYRASILSLTGILHLVFLRRKWASNAESDLGLVNVGAWLMIALLPLVGVSTVIADRFSYYLVPIQTMIFARVPFLELRRNRNLLIVLPYIGLTVMFAIWSLYSVLFNDCYIPYRSWLFSPDDFGLKGF